ncbi:hypothetical protein SCANM63S_00831 [Streptomyces canarius]
MTGTDAPLPPDELADRLTEVFALVGPLYRRVHRKVEQAEPIEGLSVTASHRRLTPGTPSSHRCAP